MEYIKNPMMIEEKSFIMIQEIIDEIRPGYKFKNEIYVKNMLTGNGKNAILSELLGTNCF